MVSKGLFSLQLEMFNHVWDEIHLYFPVFKTLEECQWWSEYLSYIFREHHDAIIYINKCVMVTM